MTVASGITVSSKMSLALIVASQELSGFNDEIQLTDLGKTYRKLKPELRRRINNQSNFQDIWYHGYSQLEEGPTGRNGRKFLGLLLPAAELCGMSEDGTRVCLGPEAQRVRPEGTRI
jgi:hypothetical protein